MKRLGYALGAAAALTLLAGCANGGYYEGAYGGGGGYYGDYAYDPYYDPYFYGPGVGFGYYDFDGGYRGYRGGGHAGGGGDGAHGGGGLGPQHG